MAETVGQGVVVLTHVEYGRLTVTDAKNVFVFVSSELLDHMVSYFRDVGFPGVYPYHLDIGRIYTG